MLGSIATHSVRVLASLHNEKQSAQDCARVKRDHHGHFIVRVSRVAPIPVVD